MQRCYKHIGPQFDSDMLKLPSNFWPNNLRTNMSIYYLYNITYIKKRKQVATFPTMLVLHIWNKNQVVSIVTDHEMIRPHWYYRRRDDMEIVQSLLPTSRYFSTRNFTIIILPAKQHLYLFTNLHTIYFYLIW